MFPAPNKKNPQARINRKAATQDAIGTAPVVASDCTELVYQSAAMHKVVSLIGMLSNSRSTVLITGESGTGKELIARAIHQNSNRAGEPFFAYNCSSIPEEIAESELFGHRKGAFTSAHSDFPGIIRSAEGGTIFLDEIGDMPLKVQPKLLRFLEHGEVKPLGEAKVIRTDVRVITATNRDLSCMVKNGQFRADLWYRLNVIAIALPPLRERREDIPLLAEHFLRRISAREGKPCLRIALEVMERLIEHDWPGNVRELANEIERLIVFTPSHCEITQESLSPIINRCDVSANPGNGWVMEMVPPPSGTKLIDAVEAYERMVISEAIRRHNSNLTRTARELGISRLYLRNKLKKMADNERG